MSLFTLDLRTVLFGLLLLPIAGALLMAAVIQINRRQRGAKERVDWLAELFAQAPVGLLQLDQMHQLVSANAQAKVLLGLASGDATLPDRPWAELLQADLSEDGHYRTVELADEDGTTRVIRWWIRPQPTGTTVLLFDLTNEQQAEQTANRLLSDLSHELRTPMATLLTHLEVLSLPEISPEVQQQSLGFMKDEVQRLTRLSNRTLELGRLQTGATVEPQPVLLFSLAESVVSQMQIEAAAKESQIDLEADDQVPAVWGDSDQLRQVFLNLIDNAIKYGGEQNRVVVTLQRSEPGVVCTVRDSGPGIPEEHLANLERRYYRADPKAALGSGLGLSMVREILRRHNAQLEITSQFHGHSRGTAMRFTLAAVDEEGRR